MRASTTVTAAVVATLAAATLAAAVPAAVVRAGDAGPGSDAALAAATGDPTVGAPVRSVASLVDERGAGGVAAASPTDGVAGPLADARKTEPVVLTGADLPGWAAPAATGQPATFPSGGSDDNPIADGIRSAHNGVLAPSLDGTIVAPPPAGSAVPVDQIVAYRWDGLGWTEVPVQVDERFPYFLSNGRSDFGFYSNTDTELTYAWGPTATTVGEEAWKKVAGQCEARYPTAGEADALVAAGVITPGMGETAADYTAPMADPVAGLDTDDEVAFYASDAGALAPPTEPGPAGTMAGTRQQVALTDPTSGNVSYVYLFQSEAGPSFDESTGYVDFARAADADRWLDRHLWDASDPEKIGTSNRGYGPNLPGTICDENGTLRTTGGDDGTGGSDDRFVSDATVVSTPSYRLTASGRWMVRGMQVAAPGQTAPRAGTSHDQWDVAYGPDLVDRWKGRAFQQSPDSTVSLVGFEDEQVNWEANSALLGWRAGPVRAIRETWGADSGTNVTKTETFYRDVAQYRYRVRVHPIPPDGLYTSWDYNAGVATTYFNALRPDGVPIDGVNDDVGNVDEEPLGGNPMFFDAPDPTFDLPSAMYRWEQVAGHDDIGSLVYSFTLNSPTTLANADVVPYYRDDACLDDGTGDDPVQRPWPGEASTDERVQRGYAEAAGLDYEAGDRADCTKHQTQGAFGSHGLHFFVAPESDNLFVGTPTGVNEIDGTQWQFAVPMRQPTNVGEAYGTVVRAPTQAVATAQPTTPGEDGAVRAGAAWVDSTWHLGASAGQYAGQGPGMIDYHQGYDPRPVDTDDVPDDPSAFSAPDPTRLGDVHVDPNAHATTSKATYGIQGRERVSALLVEGGNGKRFAVVSNDLYIPQDAVNRRVGQLLEEHDRLVDLGLADGPKTGVTYDNLTVSVSHSHSSPYYSSTSWGPWAFEDVFDIRFFEHIARRMADAVIAAAGDMHDVEVGAATSDFSLVKRHSYGPTVGDDGTPAGYPENDVDPTIATIAFDDAHTGEPVATWVVWGEHPEMLDGNDLLASEWVNTMKRNVDREVGGVTVFSQRDLGTSETGRDAAAHAPQLRQEFAHKEYAQVEHAARLVADAVETTRAYVRDPDVEVPLVRDGTPLLVPTARVAPSAHVPIGVADIHLAPPGARVSPTVSNCRSEKAFRGNPGVPVVGLPDCAFAFGSNGTNPVLAEAGIDPRVTVDALRDAGVPVPDNYGFPSVASLQETAGVHLQAYRLGDIGITICPCEQWADQSRNIETRLNTTAGDLWYGFDWTANYNHPGWQPGVIYDGLDSDGDGAFDPGHGPLTLPDAQGRHFCVPLDADGQPIDGYDGHRPDGAASWSCRDPHWHRQRGLPEPAGEPTMLAPVPDTAFRRMKAEIYNDAAGWDALDNSLAAESEPTNPDEVWGNVTHAELQDTMVGGGYGIVLPIAMSNDYEGYIASYREYQSHDHYRKALTGLGPHSADWFATRLSTMAASLKGGPAWQTNAKDLEATAEDARMDVTVQAIGNAARALLPAYEATLPADGGTPRILTQPTDVTRFDAATVSWVGGSNFTDTAHPKVERCVDPRGTCAPDDPDAWELYATGEGEVEAVVDYPTVAELPAYRAGQFEWDYTASFEAFSSDITQPDAQGVRRAQTPPGTYRFVVTGCFRSATPTATPNTPDGFDGCGSWDPLGRVSRYTLTSDPFAVRPWDRLTVEDLRVDEAGRGNEGSTVSLAVGPQPDFPLYASNTDTLFGTEGVSPIDYPDTYDSPVAFVHDAPEWVWYGDANGDGDVQHDADDERFCFACTFRAWADTGVVASVTVHWDGVGHRSGTVDATFDPAAGRWVATLPQHARRAWVEPGGVIDAFGEVNGQASAVLSVGPGKGGGGADVAPQSAVPDAPSGAPSPSPSGGLLDDLLP